MPTTFNLNSLLGQFGRQLTTGLINTGTNLLTNRLLGLSPQGVQLGNLTIPNSLLGGGLLLGSAALGKEPGEVAEARQFTRNIFTTPEFLGQNLAKIVPQLEQTFDPFLQRQRQFAVEALQGPFIAAHPNLRPSGTELATIQRGLAEEFFPREREFIGNAALNLLAEQPRAARSLLESSRPDPFAQAVGQLGGMLLARDLLGGQQAGTQLFDQSGNLLGSVGTDGAFLPTGAGSQLLPSLRPGVLQGQLGSQVANLLLTTGGQTILSQAMPELGQLLLPQGPGGPVAVDLLSSLIAAPGQSFLYTSSRGATAIVSPGEAALLQAQGAGKISPLSTGSQGIGLGTTLGALGAGVLGTQLGKGAFPEGERSSLGTGLGGATGGLLGAALGTAIAPGIGTVIGAGLGSAAGSAAGGAVTQPDISLRETAQGALGGGLFGGLGGFFAAQGDVSTKEALRDATLTALGTAVGDPLGGAIVGGILGKQRGDKIEKAQRRAADLQAQNNNISIAGSFWTSALGLAGSADVDRFGAFIDEQLRVAEAGALPFAFDGISGTEDQQEAIVRVGSTLLLQELQKISPEITDLDQIPGFRSRYIDFLMENYRIESGGGLSRPSDIGQFGSFLDAASLERRR